MEEGELKPPLDDGPQIYGPIFTIWIGPVAMVMVTDYETGQESMIKKGAAFVDRQHIYMLDITRRKGSFLLIEPCNFQKAAVS